MKRRFRGLRTDLGLPEDVRPHTLRHTFVAVLLTNGVAPFVVSRLAGHSDLQVTTRVYGHLIRQETTAAEMGRAMRGARESAG